MNGTRTSHRALACALVLLAFGAARPSAAYRLFQSFATGQVTDFNTTLVQCNNPNGFLHWPSSNVNFFHNPSGKGSDKAAALYNALNGWNFTSGVAYTPTYAGTTAATFGIDGTNSLSWGTDSGCTGPCIALTMVIVSQPGQVITETDVIFRSDLTWTTTGGQYDTWAVAAHEIGHTLGIAHSEFSSSTMWANYIGTNGRSLETDDRSALQCSQNRYPPANTCVPDGGADDVLGVNSCCSGLSVPGSIYCTNPADFNNGWASCHQICASQQVGGCVPSGGVDDILSQSSCCSGAAVQFSARCLNPAHWSNGWASCIQTCL